MSLPQKVSLYSVNDLKNATDDALVPYLTSLPKPYAFKQQHQATNVRLALGYTAVIIAGVLFYADWRLGWDATKVYTAPACVAYFVLNGALSYWIWAVEAGTVFVGVREGGQKLTLKSSTQKYKPSYKLKVLYEAPSGKKSEDKEVEGSFTQWFNTQGYLQTEELHSWLNGNIDALGGAAEQEKPPRKDRVLAFLPDDGFVEGENSPSAAALSTGIDNAPMTPGGKKGRAKKKA